MDDRTREAVEFRQRLHEASREVQQAAQDEAEQGKACYCQVCAHTLTTLDMSGRCESCVKAEHLGIVGIDGDEQTACFFLYTLLDPKGKRRWVGAASGDEFGNWTESDRAEYWPKDDDIERAVQKRFRGVKVPNLALTDWHVTPDGSQVALYFAEIRTEPEAKPAKKSRAKK